MNPLKKLSTKNIYIIVIIVVLCLATPDFIKLYKSIYNDKAPKVKVQNNNSGNRNYNDSFSEKQLAILGTEQSAVNKAEEDKTKTLLSVLDEQKNKTTDDINDISNKYTEIKKLLTEVQNENALENNKLKEEINQIKLSNEEKYNKLSLAIDGLKDFISKRASGIHQEGSLDINSNISGNEMDSLNFVPEMKYKEIIWQEERQENAPPIGNAEEFVSKRDNAYKSKKYLVIPTASECHVRLAHDLSLRIGQSKTCTFDVISPFKGVAMSKVDFRTMRVQGNCNAHLKGDTEGYVDITITKISIVRSTGKTIEKTLQGSVSSPNTETGSLEGKNVAKIAKPLLMRFLLNSSIAGTKAVSDAETTTTNSALTGTTQSVVTGDPYRATGGQAIEGGLNTIKETTDKFFGDIQPIIKLTEGSIGKLITESEVLFENLTIDEYKDENQSEL